MDILNDVLEAAADVVDDEELITAVCMKASEDVVDVTRSSQLDVVTEAGDSPFFINSSPRSTVFVLERL